MDSVNSNSLKEILSADFKSPSGETREQFLFLLKVWNNFEGFSFIFDDSQLNKTDTGFLITPIVILKNADQKFYSAAVKNEQGKWKINALTFTTKIPETLTRKYKKFSLPEHSITFPITINLYDENSGNPVYARVHIEDKNGEYWPAQGHQNYISTNFNKQIGGDVFIENKVFAYVKPHFTVDLPVGKYQIYISKGME